MLIAACSRLHPFPLLASRALRPRDAPRTPRPAGVALLAALTCFTQAGKRSKAIMHKSQLNGRFGAVVGGFAIAFGALTLGGMWLVDQIDIPIRYTLLGVLVVALIAVTQPLYRVLLHRTTA
jgi:hypothetical protein